jgi:S1-C subfamily serine protease
MGFDDGLDDDERAFRAPLPPDDRLRRHPSEVGDDADDAADPWLGFATTPVQAPRPVRSWQVAIVSGLSGALLATGLAVLALDQREGGTRVIERVAPRTVGSNIGRVADVVPDAVELVRPAIVQLVADVGAGQISGGSGVLFRDDGHILTNQHVVRGADSITVVTNDGREHDAVLLGGDPDTDLAVVKIEGGPYPVATLGSATGLRTGESCIAIGSPGGLAGGPSVSVGVVSALGRTLERGGDRDLFDMIQTDAAISPGSSGGALLDLAGHVIGITTAIVVSDAGAEGLGFATPIDIARLVAEELIAKGEVVHVWLGIEGTDVAQAEADRLDIEGGAAVHKVVAGSPAAAAGVAPGDIILTVNDQPVATMAALVVALRSLHAGETANLGVMRGGKRIVVRAVLAERPANARS